MHVSYSFAGSVLTLCSTADFQAGELQEVLAQALADPNRPELSGTLIDLRASPTLAARTTHELIAAAYVLAAVAEKLGRIALLAATDLTYGLMRMISGRADRGVAPIEVFRDEGAAMAWLTAGRP